ncbi:MAG: serine/threonine-protein kinase [Thermodesulfobacteriota bacterium]|nr:serine/threonine-protein kinase [Thermodesulfobacteriota bacterium]
MTKLKVGNYKIVERKETGGMATVYRGVQVSLNRPVAIKILHEKMFDNPDMVKRFNREAAIIARLDHPHIIRIIDRGITEGGRPYFVMNYVNGHTLRHFIGNNECSVNHKLGFMIQACKALAYAHKNRVIHRDIKPGNILIDTEDHVFVTDFGIAQSLNLEQGSDEMTRPGTVMGSVSYMSPEQRTHFASLTAASDLYSLGVVLYELLTNEKPLGHFKPPSALNPEIPRPVNDLILKCLMPKPEERFTSADEIKDILLRTLQGDHIGPTARKKMADETPKMEDHFVLLDIIKEHSYGSVYLVRYKKNNTLMVAKLYKSPLGGRKEAAILTTLEHENIIDIHGVSTYNGTYLILMAYISGGSLAERLIRPFHWKRALRVTLQICRGLSFAHKNRIFHGNLRPSNVLITVDGNVKISDFGLTEHYTNDNNRRNWYSSPLITDPERQDIFSAGTILYKMLTGKVPSMKDARLNESRIFKKHPREVQAIIFRMLATDSEKGYKTADQALADINHLLQHPPAQKNSTSSSQIITPKNMQQTLLLVILLLFTFLAYQIFTGNGQWITDLLDRTFQWVGQLRGG